MLSERDSSLFREAISPPSPIALWLIDFRLLGKVKGKERGEGERGGRKGGRDKEREGGEGGKDSRGEGRRGKTVEERETDNREMQ